MTVCRRRLNRPKLIKASVAVLVNNYMVKCNTCRYECFGKSSYTVFYGLRTLAFFNREICIHCTQSVHIQLATYCKYRTFIVSQQPPVLTEKTIFKIHYCCLREDRPLLESFHLLLLNLLSMHLSQFY